MNPPTTLELAHCPGCGSDEGTFLRSATGLVCAGCLDVDSGTDGLSTNRGLGAIMSRRARGSAVGGKRRP